MTTKFIPDGFHAVTPYLIVQGAERLLVFVKAAFDAEKESLLISRARFGLSTMLTCC
jgi:hypothetical protein